MPIVSSDIKIRLSIKTGSAGNSAAQPDPNASLGKYISTTDLVDNTLNNLFDNISGDENAASTVDYRCVFVYNSHATLTLFSPKVWFVSQVAGGADMDMALDSTAASDVASSAAQALSVANETTAPAGPLTFSNPTSKAAGLSIGDLTPGQVKGIWIRRTATNSAALNSDGGQIRVEGDTGA
jgi:hypothetical protein